MILTNFIWAVQMPGFMLISGYLSFRKVDSLGKCGQRILNGIEHYAMPFISWFILISVLLLGKFNHNIMIGLTMLFTHIDIGLWFLWVLFVFSVIATFCNYISSSEKSIIRKTYRILIFCLLILIVLALMAMLYGLKFAGIKYILYYSIFYGFGWGAKATEQIWRVFWRRHKNSVSFICLVIFLAIIFNYDLYHCPDDLKSIVLRYIAGFTGNNVLLITCMHLAKGLEKMCFDRIGRYTLEIYCTHMYVNNLFAISSKNSFFTCLGFINFLVSLACTVTFTVIIITVIKSIPLANWLMYGKRE